MDELNATLLRKLNKTSPLGTPVFGDFISPECFHQGKSALVLSTDSVYIIGDTQETVKAKFLQITELLSLLRYMEENHIIYLLHQHQIDDLTILYQDCNDLKRQQDGLHYEMGNGHQLYINGDIIEIHDGNNTPILQHQLEVSSLRTEIVNFLFAFVYPTAALEKFIEHDFLTENDYHNRLSVRLSRRSLWIAVFVAAISPLLSLCLGNRWGVTHLDEKQYDRLIKTNQDTETIIKPVYYPHEQDTIKPLSGH